MQVHTTANNLDPLGQELVEERKQLYATEPILGKPQEIDGLKIIPLATEVLATFFALVAERGLKFGLFPWP
jgi:hypothetical protein